MAGISAAIARRSGSLSVSLGVLVFAVGAWQVEGFASLRSVRAILVLASFVALASIGQTIVVIMGGIDLSIPFLIGVANVVGAKAFEAGLPAPVVIALVMGLTGLIGALNGFLSKWFAVHPLIVTLGVGTMAQAGVLLWTAGFPAGVVPDWVTKTVSIGSSTGPIPFPPLVLLMAAITIGIVVMERRTVFGRRIFGLGANPVAAELTLIRPLRMWMLVFGMSAAFAGLAGLLLLGFTGKASGTVGQPYLFQTIAAVVVGGTSLTGGSGGFAKTVVGSIVLIELTSLLLALGVPSSLIQSALGGLIVVLVSIYGREAHVRERI